MSSQNLFIPKDIRPQHKYDGNPNELIPTSQSGFYDADLLGDLAILTQVPVRIENIHAIRKLIRHIQGKIVHRLITLKSFEMSGYKTKGLQDALVKLKNSLEGQSQRLNEFEQALLVRDSMIHQQLIKIQKKKMNNMLQTTQDKVKALRKHLVDANMKKHFLGILVQKKLQGGQ